MKRSKWRGRREQKRERMAPKDSCASRPERFDRDDELRWYFVDVGRSGERRLRIDQLLKWRRIDRAIQGKWRLCLYFTNPRNFADPLFAPMVHDDGSHDATELYGIPADERTKWFHDQEREYEGARLYAAPTDETQERGFVEQCAWSALAKEYAAYRGLLAGPRSGEWRCAIVPANLLAELVGGYWGTRLPCGRPDPIESGNVVDEYWWAGRIYWSTWRDYEVYPDAAKTILHNRQVSNVGAMSARQLVEAVGDLVKNELRHAQEQEEAERLHAEAKVQRTRRVRVRGKGKILELLSSPMVNDLTVRGIAEHVRLSQRRIRELLVAQACHGVTMADGDPAREWFGSDAGAAFASALADAIEADRNDLKAG